MFSTSKQLGISYSAIWQTQNNELTSCGDQLGGTDAYAECKRDKLGGAGRARHGHARADPRPLGGELLPPTEESRWCGKSVAADARMRRPHALGVAQDVAVEFEYVLELLFKPYDLG